MKHAHRLLWVCAVGVLIASCASAPTPKPASTAPATTKPQAAAPNAELQQAKDLKAQIDKYGLSTQSPNDYQQGVTDLTAGENAMGTDNVTAKAKLDAAIAAFKKVEQAGFPKLIQDREQQVGAARDEAKAAKADVAAAETFDQAQTYDQQAEQKKNAGDYASAYDLLGQSLETYKQSTQEAKQKRLAAEQALKEANAQLDSTKSQVDELQKNLQASKAQNGGGQ